MIEEKKGKIMNLKLLWYCTKGSLKLYKTIDKDYTTKKAEDNIFGYEELNGKIVAMSDFDCEEIIHTYENGASVHHDYSTKTLDNEQLLRKSRIFGQGLDDYLGDRNYDKNNNVVGYAIHIKNLNVFDKPKKISDFYKRTEKVNPDIICDFCTNYPFDKCKECRDNYDYFNLKRAPQNMMYVYDYLGDKYVLISVHPEWLAMILNGLKTIEVRKQVLNCMKGN